MTDIDAKVSEIVAALNSNTEHFIARYLAATGASIEDTMLVQQTVGDQIRMWCEPKENIRG